jgi:DNA invertase Pin-like site-specific DNA recombinase
MRSAIYARMGTKDQSCDMQMRDLRACCAARGFIISREYTDLGQSGAKDSRPELNELMADAHERKFDLVLVWRFDRFTRSTKHLLLALEEFRSLGVQSSPIRKTLIRARRSGRRCLPLWLRSHSLNAI